MENKYLTLARRAREEDNKEDAKTYYQMLKTEEPDNGEARFFAPYYDLLTSTKGETYNKFVNFCKAMAPVVKSVAGSADAEEEKVALLKAIYYAFENLPIMMHNIQADLWGTAPDSKKPVYNEQRKHVGKAGTEAFYAYGDAIAAAFTTPSAKEVALLAWKKAVELQQKWPYYKIQNNVEEYVAKIQAIDPTYVLPKKAGCISFAKYAK